MANQFDIVENLNASTLKQYPFLVILQHDRVNAIQSVIAAPLVERTTALAGTKIHPEVVIDSQTYIVLVEQLAAIPRKFGGNKVGTAESKRYELVAAIDLLFTGI